MAKSAAAKSAAKKKNRKLKRQIRKTVGALLMVSAIAVAAVPVPDISANPADNTVIKVAVTDSREATNDFNGATAGYESEIPLATSTTPIYTSGEGMYQFAYIDEVAVILQYNGGYLEGNSVVIPDTIEGYKKYTDNLRPIEDRTWKSNAGERHRRIYGKRFAWKKIRERHCAAEGWYLLCQSYGEWGNNMPVMGAIISN